MNAALLTPEEKMTIVNRAATAFVRGVQEAESDVTWADPGRKEGELTPYDDAYDAGREWARLHMLDER